MWSNVDLNLGDFMHWLTPSSPIFSSVNYHFPLWALVTKKYYRSDTTKTHTENASVPFSQLGGGLVHPGLQGKNACLNWSQHGSKALCRSELQGVKKKWIKLFPGWACTLREDLLETRRFVEVPVSETSLGLTLQCCWLTFIFFNRFNWALRFCFFFSFKEP